MRSLLILFSILLLSETSSLLYAQSKPEVVIGAILPLSGNGAAFGVEASRAIEIFTRDRFPLSDKYNFQIQVQDGKCGQGSGAITAGKYLVDTYKIPVMLVGCSGEVLQLATFIMEKKIPIIGVVSGSPDVRTAGPYVYRTYPDLSSGTNAISEYILSQNVERIGLLTEVNSFTSSIKKLLMASLGTKIVADEEISAEETQFATAITKARSKNPDMCYMNMASPTSYQNMILQIKRQGIQKPLLAYYSPADKSSLKNLDAVQNGVLFFDVPEVVNPGQRYKNFLNTYLAKHPGGPESPFLLATAYNALIAIASAIDHVVPNPRCNKNFSRYQRS